MKRVNFEIAMNKEKILPKCVNCGGIDWKKNKKGEHYCLECGHKVMYLGNGPLFKNSIDTICKKGM